MAKISIVELLKKNSVILLNTSSLIGTMLVTSGLGFAYWFVAARYFSTEAVGLASAATSAMMLLSTIFLLGQGTLLISELPRSKNGKGSLISASMLLVGISSLIGGILFAFLTPIISPELQQLGATPQNALLFALGACLAAVTVVIDHAVIGLLQGGLQLWRNALFAIAKLIFLFILGQYLAQNNGISIYTTWTLGNLISLLPIAIYMIRKRKWSLHYYRPQWDIMKKLGPSAFQHHILNLILQAPSQVLPILVTILLTAQANARFYMASMIANFIFSLSFSLTTVLHAANANKGSTLTQKTRLTVGLSFLASFIMGGILIVIAEPILSIFGPNYVADAAPSLRILLIAALPLTIKNHYIAICRIKDQVSNAIIPVTIGAFMEVAIAAIGAIQGGLAGLSLGWVIAMSLEALLMLPVVLRTLIGKSALERKMDEIAETETMLLPALNQFAPSGVLQLMTYGNTVTVTEVDTIQMPAIRKTNRIQKNTTTAESITEAPTIAIAKADLQQHKTQHAESADVSEQQTIEQSKAHIKEALAQQVEPTQKLKPTTHTDEFEQLDFSQLAIPPVEEEEKQEDETQSEQLDFAQSEKDENQQSEEIEQLDFDQIEQLSFAGFPQLPDTPPIASEDIAGIEALVEVTEQEKNQETTEDDDEHERKELDVAVINTMHIRSANSVKLAQGGQSLSVVAKKAESAKKTPATPPVDEAPTMALAKVDIEAQTIDEAPTMALAKVAIEAQAIDEAPTMALDKSLIQLQLIDDLPTTVLSAVKTDAKVETSEALTSTMREHTIYNWAWIGGIVLVTLAVLCFTLIVPGTALQPLSLFVFLILCPGMAWVRIFSRNNIVQELTLGIALGLSIDALVVTCFLYSRIWIPAAMLIVISLITFIGVGIQSYIFVRPKNKVSGI